MTQVKLTSDKGDVLFATVDGDGDYHIEALNTFVFADDLERGDYPGWSVEKIIELPTKLGAVIAHENWNPYILVKAGWTEVQKDGEAYLVNDGEPIGAEENLKEMIEKYGFEVVYEGYGDANE